MNKKNNWYPCQKLNQGPVIPIVTRIPFDISVDEGRFVMMEILKTSGSIQQYDNPCVHRQSSTFLQVAVERPIRHVLVENYSTVRSVQTLPSDRHNIRMDEAKTRKRLKDYKLWHLQRARFLLFYLVIRFNYLLVEAPGLVSFSLVWSTRWLLATFEVVRDISRAILYGQEYDYMMWQPTQQCHVLTALLNGILDNSTTRVLGSR